MPKIVNIGTKQISKEPSLIPHMDNMAVYLNATKGSGKSVLLLNFILNKEFYKNKYHQIYIFSPTCKLDDKFDILKTTKVKKKNTALIKALQRDNKKTKIIENRIPIDPVNLEMTDADFFDDIDIDFLLQLRDKQALINEAYGKKLCDRVLLVFDDVLFSKKMRHEEFRKMLVNSRHYCFSYVFSGQYLKILDPKIRLNISCLVLFANGNTDNLKDIYKEYSCGLEWKEWKSYYDYCVAEDFGFMTLIPGNPNKKKVIKNFETFLSNESF